VTDWAGIYGLDQQLSCALWLRIPEGLELTNYSGIVGWGIPGNSNAKWKVFVRHDSIEEAPTVSVAIGAEQGIHWYEGETRLDDNQWHHIAVVQDGKDTQTGVPEISVYIDGERETITHSSLSLEMERFNSLEEIIRHPATRPLAIGKGPVPQDVTFQGLIDELYIFDGTISQAEIRKLLTQTTTNKR